MTVLYITEYAELQIGPAGRVGQMPMEVPIAEQAIAITAGSTQSAAFNAKTRSVRIHTDAICGITFGTNPTATVVSAGLGSQRLAANQTQFHGVPLGQSFKVAVIATT